MVRWLVACSAFGWSVPWLSVLAIIVLSIAAVILYHIPLRWLALAWGVNKFTKKLRAPNAIDNNELLDYLSRVPSNRELVRSASFFSNTFFQRFHKIDISYFHILPVLSFFYKDSYYTSGTGHYNSTHSMSGTRRVTVGFNRVSTVSNVRVGIRVSGLNRSRCCLGCGLGCAQGSMCYMGVYIGAIWRIRLNRPYAAAMRPFGQMTLTTCWFCS